MISKHQKMLWLLCIVLFIGSIPLNAQNTSETIPQVGTIQKIGDVILFALPVATAGTSFGSITKDDLFNLKLCIPNKDVLEKFKKIADPFHDKIVVNSKENQKLSELRDWLLPMLMNGQVTVGEVEQELGMVAEERETYN